VVDDAEVVEVLTLSVFFFLAMVMMMVLPLGEGCDGSDE
jgi:hypothetical protein